MSEEVKPPDDTGSVASHCSPSLREQWLRKCCDRCGCDSVTVMTASDPSVQPMTTDDDCECDSCGLTGYIVENGCDGDFAEDCFDVQWIDPGTGEAWRI